jgi:glycosyltransferase involved in cell wall biosynthesis
MSDVLQAVHIVGSLDRGAGGPAYSVPALVQALNVTRVSAIIRAAEIGDLNISSSAPYVVGYHPPPLPLARRLHASRKLRRAINGDAAGGAILHTHGLWLMPNVYPAWAKRRWPGTAKLVHSPRGMLGGPALNISKLKKRVFWTLLQRAALEAADCLHATALSEYEDVRASGLIAPVAVIPNGIDIPEIDCLPRPSGRTRTVLSLGRIHPKKALDRLVYAWANLEREFPDWSVRIVGSVERGYDAELRGLAARLGLQRLTIEEPVYGEAKTATYREADLFVLPTLHENFAVTVAEALAAEVPVISTNGAPWTGLETERCGWWIDQGVEALTQAMSHAMRVPRSELHAMGARGRRWMARDFGWDKVAREMGTVYSWLSHGGPPPPMVRLQ